MLNILRVPQNKVNRFGMTWDWVNDRIFIFGWTILYNMTYTIIPNLYRHRTEGDFKSFSYLSSVRLAQFWMIWRVQTHHLLVRQSACISIFFSLEKEKGISINASESFWWIIWKSLVQLMLLSSEHGKVRLSDRKYPAGSTCHWGSTQILNQKGRKKEELVSIKETCAVYHRIHRFVMRL